MFSVVVEGISAPAQYKQNDTLNPNRKKYRLLWQAAYAAVVATIRQNKGIRSEWQKYGI